MDDISRYLEEQLRLSENELAAPNSTAQDLLTTDQTAEVPAKKNTRFKPGQSGNPRGRPPKRHFGSQIY